IAALIWSDPQPADPAAALHSQVSRLRRTLPDARLETEPPGYVLRVATDEVDAGRFDRLGEAGARGGAPRAGARLHATEQWHRARLDSGQAARSLPRLEAFVAEHPLRESARDLLLRTRYAL